MMSLLVVIIFFTAVSGEAPLYTMKNKIAGSYIVAFKANSDVDTSIADIKFLLSSSGEGQVHHEYSKAFKGVAATLSEKDLELIRHLDFVDYVEEDEMVHASVEWGLDRIDQRDLPLDNLYSPKGDGSGVDVYVLDTGINQYHSVFGGRASTASYMDFVSSPRNGTDCEGHGTHVAGIIAEVARQVQIYGVRVLDCSGEGTTSRVLNGMEHVQKRSGKRVVCMSLSEDASKTLDTAVTNLYNAGVPVIAAAGNDRRDACNYSPANASKAYTVAATDSHDVVTDFSNWGDCVDIFAPGDSIISASHTSNSEYGSRSGTSMAAAFVAGAAAIECSILKSCNPSSVYDALTNNATLDKIDGVRFGLSPNRLVYVGRR